MKYPATVAGAVIQLIHTIILLQDKYQITLLVPGLLHAQFASRLLQKTYITAMVLLLYNRSSNQLNSELFSYYLSKLPGYLQQKIMRFRKWEDAQRSLFGNLLVLEGLKASGYENADAKEIMYTEYNRPYMQGMPDFNVSHSGEFTVCAITQKNILGVDIEEVKHIPVEDFTGNFSEEEMRRIIEDKSLEYFYTLWTQKEAFLKAIGKGLNVPLNQVQVNDSIISWQGKNWYLHELKLDAGYKCHVCIDTPKPEIETREIKFQSY